MSDIVPASLFDKTDEEIRWENAKVVTPVKAMLWIGLPAGKSKQKSRGIFYNQKLVNPGSCTVVWTFTALSNKTGLEIRYATMIRVVDELRESGKFKDSKGAYLKDVVPVCVRVFNEIHGTNLKARPVNIDASSLWAALNMGPVVTSIRLTKTLGKDERDNAMLDSPLEVLFWLNWHAVALTGMYTTQSDIFVQYAQSWGYLADKNIITANFKKYRPMFANIGYYFV